MLPLRVKRHNFFFDETAHGFAPHIMFLVEKFAFDHARLALSFWVDAWIASRAACHCASVMPFKSAKVPGVARCWPPSIAMVWPVMKSQPSDMQKSDQVLQFLHLAITAHRHCFAAGGGGFCVRNRVQFLPSAFSWERRRAQLRSGGCHICPIQPQATSSLRAARFSPWPRARRRPSPSTPTSPNC